MKNPNTAIKTFAAVLALVVFCLVPAVTEALDVYLAAMEYTKVMSDGTPVTMWGYAETDQAFYQTRGLGGTVLSPPSSPGPEIVVPATGGGANRRLRIYLTNMLPVPTSIVIPGQEPPYSAANSGPTWDTGPAGPRTSPTQRVRSFGRHAAAFSGAGGGRRAYLWTIFRENLFEPGTYLYQSGTDPALQVQMGLYGAVTKDQDLAPAGTAYAGIDYDQDVVVIYSEIDPALHDPPTSAASLNYKPKYFLVNGVDSGDSVLTAGAEPPLNSRVLLRFLNAGLRNITPTLLGEDLEWVAEDGGPYPYSRMSYSAFLGAGKTMDAIWVPVSVDRHALYDRRLGLSTNGIAGGGQLAFLDSATADVPIANAGPDQDLSLLPTPPTILLAGGASGGSGTGYTYQWDFVAFPGAFAPTLADPTASSTTFDIGDPGAYTLQLVVTDSLSASSTPDPVNIFTNLPPVAVASAVPTTVEAGEVIDLTGDTSYDPEAAAIGYSWTVNGGTAGIAAPTAANTTFTPAAPGSYTAALTVTELAGDLLASDPSTVALTVTAAENDPPVADPDFYTVDKNSEFVQNPFWILDNDSDEDGTLDPASIVIVTPPTQGGEVMVFGDGHVEYWPRRGWRGTDYFTYTVDDNLGATSNVASVTVNVVQFP